MECLDVLTTVWKDPIVQQAIRRGNEVASPEEMPYFFSLPRLLSPEYLPSPQDIFHLRARTIGITETMISLNGIEMLVVDVGGAKSERRKRIHVCTAYCSTEGANQNFLFWDIFKEFPISQPALHRFT
ncbi:G-protein alpha subunit-domain-containing protein [Mycena rosella]|uniref:G-protein alpha subunit-domain-containing protein n=1 Tax=Mycena rosella TaxID=1033263 RepID=A0AAD7CV80_MYCRO|nr:G-protein alpha subunit-domain-containing protein [Mycena rosella]